MARTEPRTKTTATPKHPVVLRQPNLSALPSAKVYRLSDQWNCSSSVEPVRAFTLDEPPWITVVTSSK